MTEIRWLEAFIAVAEELHFGRAAERLRMAQSPLSQTIRKLESDLGVPLFVRNTRSVSLTAAGDALLPRAYRVIQDMRRAREAAQAVTGEVRGTIRIGFSGAVNHLTLPRLTRALRRNHPGIEVELTSRVRTGDGLDSVRSGALDIAFVGLPEALTAPLAARLIGREVIGAVLPLDHPLADRDYIALEDMAGDDWITPPLDGSSSMSELLLTACAAAGFRPIIAQQTPDPYILLTFVAAGVGVTLSAESMRNIVPTGAIWIPLSGSQHYMMDALSWSEENESEVLRTVLHMAEEVLPTPQY